jgi:hypothetical protein
VVGDTFRTADGYTLRRIGSVWTDDDLVFSMDADGYPVDYLGERLDGE